MAKGKNVKNKKEIKSKRISLYPIQYPSIWKMVKKQEGLMWKLHEVDFSQDQKDWKSGKIKKAFKKIIMKNFGFFIVSEDVVIDTASSIGEDLPDHYKEAKRFIIDQICQEAIHEEGYSSSFYNITDDDKEREEVLDFARNSKALNKKVEWMKKYCSSEAPLAERIIACMCTEGIFLQGAFTPFLKLGTLGLMPGLVMMNGYIRRDEFLHKDWWCTLLFTLIQDGIVKMPKISKIEEIIGSAVAVEKQYNIEMLDGGFEELTKENLSDYDEAMGEILFRDLNMKSYYGKFKTMSDKIPIPKDLSYMNMSALDGKTNFFEKRVLEYGAGKTEKEEVILDLDLDI